MAQKYISGSRHNKKSSINIHESILNEVRKLPSGIRFSDLQKNLKISPSVLSNHLQDLIRELKVIKSNNLYRPSGSDLHDAILSQCMDAVDQYLSNSKGGAEIVDIIDGKLNGALNIFLNLPEHPTHYDYSKIAKDDQVLSLLKLLQGDLKHSTSKVKIALANFILNFVNFRCVNLKIPLNKELIRILEEIEDECFKNAIKNENYLASLRESEWLPIYWSLVGAKSTKIRDILERFIFPGPESHSNRKTVTSLEPEKMDNNKLIELKTFINNDLLVGWAHNGFNTEYADEVLYFMTSELTTLELEFADKNVLYAGFLHDLREGCDLRWGQKNPKNQ